MDGRTIEKRMVNLGTRNIQGIKVKYTEITPVSPKLNPEIMIHKPNEWRKKFECNEHMWMFSVFCLNIIEAREEYYLRFTKTLNYDKDWEAVEKKIIRLNLNIVQ